MNVLFVYVGNTFMGKLQNRNLNEANHFVTFNVGYNKQIPLKTSI